MPNDIEYNELYLDIAKRISKMSKAVRLKVGAVIVKDHSIVSYGYNGTPSGDDNCCEERKKITGAVKKEELDATNPDNLVTKSNVIHAEMNAVLKLVGRSENVDGATMYITHPPCLKCSEFITQTDVIKKVVYGEEYKNLDGVEYLRSKGIKVESYHEAKLKFVMYTNHSDFHFTKNYDGMDYAIYPNNRNDPRDDWAIEPPSAKVVLEEYTKWKNITFGMKTVVGYFAPLSIVEKNVAIGIMAGRSTGMGILSKVIRAVDRPDMIGIGAIIVKAKMADGLQWQKAVTNIDELVTPTDEFMITLIIDVDGDIMGALKKDKITYAIVYRGIWVVYDVDTPISVHT